MDRPTFYTVEEFAAQLRVSDEYVRRLISEGKLAYRDFGERTRRIPAVELDRLVEESLQVTAAPSEMTA